MKSIRIQKQSFIQSLLKPATKLWEVNDNDSHHCLSGFNSPNIYFKYRKFPPIDGLDSFEAKEIIELSSIQFRNQMRLSQLGLSKYILEYNTLILSYPYACFIHESAVNNLVGLMKEQLSFTAKLNLMIQIATGVQDLHKQNISIRSLRPTTIVILNRNQDDFQIAFSQFRNFAILEDGSELQKPVFNEVNAYVAPEIYKGEELENSQPCDIWSLGLILYEILFDQKINKAKVDQTGALEFPNLCPKWQTNIIEKMLVYQPKDRIKIRDILILLKNARLSCKERLK